MFYLTMVIDLFRESLCSVRKAEELPFALRRYCKFIDVKEEKKKIMKYKEFLLKTIMNIEMFFRLHNDLFIDDLLGYLSFCGASKFKIIQTLLRNFMDMFGISRKKMEKLGESNFHLLEVSDLEKCGSWEEFVRLGTMYLYQVSEQRQVQPVRESERAKRSGILLSNSPQVKREAKR